MDETASGQWPVRKGQQQLLRTPPPPPPQAAPANTPAWVPYLRTPDTPSDTAASSATVTVTVTYQAQAVPGVTVTALGCTAPVLAQGRTDSTDWYGDVAGPLCQIVLSHPQIDDGRGFIYQVPAEVPAKAQDSTARRFHFAVQPPPPDRRPPPGTPLNATLAVEKGVLVWQRGGRAMHYKKE